MFTQKHSMKKAYFVVLVFVFLSQFIASYTVVAKELYGVKVDKDIVFVNREEVSLKADLYRPTDKHGNILVGSLPAFVLVHGGAFVIGSKDLQFKDLAKWLAQRGYVAFNITYRLGEKGQFPKNILDVKCAIRFLRGNAKNFGIDSNRLGIIGGSAGGYLTAFVAATGDNPDFEPSCGQYDNESTQVQVSIPVYGLYEFENVMEDHSSELSRIFFTSFAGEVKDEKDLLEKMKKTSVLTYVTKKTDIKWLIIHGSNDLLIPLSQPNKLYDALKKAGIDAELAIIEKGKHGFFDLSTMDISGYKKALKVLEQWLPKKFPSSYFE